MVDKALLADRIATVRDARARIRSILPPTMEAFAGDRTAREVVVLNLFVAIQACLDLASHSLADEEWAVPDTYGNLIAALADDGVLDRALGTLTAAAGLRNLAAHQYGAVDWRRLFGAAASDLGDLEAFCAALASRAG